MTLRQRSSSSSKIQPRPGSDSDSGTLPFAWKRQFWSIKAAVIITLLAFFGVNILQSSWNLFRLFNPKPKPNNIRIRESSDSLDKDKGIVLLSHEKLDALTKDILGADEFGAGCPEGCGCPHTEVDCPRHYSTTSIEQSATALLSQEARKYYQEKLGKLHISAARACLDDGKTSTTGGWCLCSLVKKGNAGVMKLSDGRKIAIPYEHIPASENIVNTLLKFFRDENVASVSDYGAGVGQYGAAFMSKMPELVYYGYDGAGDVESYTSGLVRWFDLTQVLNNPVTDWVLSLEVGEHVPSKYEGMFIRNLHRHNCKGVILSWAILGQDGNMHINNHSNEYLTAVFADLGYHRDLILEALLRNPADNYKWFEKSTMVFRRNVAVC